MKSLDFRHQGDQTVDELRAEVCSEIDHVFHWNVREETGAQLEIIVAKKALPEICGEGSESVLLIGTFAVLDGADPGGEGAGGVADEKPQAVSRPSVALDVVAYERSKDPQNFLNRAG